MWNDLSSLAGEKSGDKGESFVELSGQSFGPSVETVECTKFQAMPLTSPFPYQDPGSFFQNELVLAQFRAAIRSPTSRKVSSEATWWMDHPSSRV